MKRNGMITYMLVCLCATSLLTGCDVHEFPNVPDEEPVQIRLKYKINVTNFTYWEHLHDGQELTEIGFGDTYSNVRDSGTIRYVVRAYPVSEGQHTAPEHAHEMVFTRDIAEGYDFVFSFSLAPGDYDIMVWADKVERKGDPHFYDAADFKEIRLQGSHCGNNDYRDAFRGRTRVSLPADIVESGPVTIDIDMERPLAKYEFVTTDLSEFVNKELLRATAKEKAADNGKEVSPRVKMEDYKVIFHYVGFMPSSYSLFTDRPVDSSTGVQFESRLSAVNGEEASMGFDYVFVNGTQSAVTVRIGIYDNEGEQLSLTDPITVPLMRNHHTLLRGEFMSSETSGGIGISPEFDGEYNLLIP